MTLMPRRMPTIFATLVALVWSSIDDRIIAADLSPVEVRMAIDRGVQFLVKEQHNNGSWGQNTPACVGGTSLCVLALINGGMPLESPPVRRGLEFLRNLSSDEGLGILETYQTSLWIMALAAGKKPSDLDKISTLAKRLVGGQLDSGGWAYRLFNVGPSEGADPSNTQFAILGLREAVDAGFDVDRGTWERARAYWENWQNQDGGWGYVKRHRPTASTGSMTVAGISSLVITKQMLRTDEGVTRVGDPQCCDDLTIDKPLLFGLACLGRGFTVQRNPGSLDNENFHYYIYGVERAGRLTGQRFFGDHDWYREGAALLLARQNPINGHWSGTGEGENYAIVSTSFSVLFLSKGLAPVLINKLKHGPRLPKNPYVIVDENWNPHPSDVRNLTEMISGLPKWPKLLSAQELDLTRAVKFGGLSSLKQAPVLFITGRAKLSLTGDEIKLIKEYVQDGGFIFACPSCHSGEFERSFRDLVVKLLPPGEGELMPLPPEHSVYRSEYLLQPKSVPLLGADLGCRTSIIYSPEDLACFWDYWAKVDPPKRNPNFKTKINRATEIGTNVIAFATGREPPDKLHVREAPTDRAELDVVERGLLQIAQIKHEGAWNAAPHALRNLLISLNETAGLSASTKVRELSLSDQNISRYPILYMHSRSPFSVPEKERQHLSQYLELGGVLVADACCSTKAFDKAFREFIAQLFPLKKLEQIPLSHELFSEKMGHEIKLLSRRTAAEGENAAGKGFSIISVEPTLEGIELDGRYAVIYSKYDISCALERKNSGNCEGYISEDAVKLGTNIIMYSMLQSLRLKAGQAAPPD